MSMKIFHNSKNFVSSKDIRNFIFKKSKGICAYCSIEMTRTGKNIKTDFCIDHIIPIKKGGKKTLNNLAAVCNSCNVKKGKRTLMEYYLYLTSKGIKSPKILAKLGGMATAKKHGSNLYKKAAKERWGGKK